MKIYLKQAKCCPIWKVDRIPNLYNSFVAFAKPICINCIKSKNLKLAIWNCHSFKELATAKVSTLKIGILKYLRWKIQSAALRSYFQVPLFPIHTLTLFLHRWATLAFYRRNRSNFNPAVKNSIEFSSSASKRSAEHWKRLPTNMPPKIFGD